MIIKYWRMVLRIAWQSAWRRAGIRVIFSVIGVIIIFLALTGILTLIGVLDFSFFRDNGISSGFAGIAQVCLSVVTLLVLFVVLVFTTPPAIYHNQGGFLENPFDITAISPYPNYGNTNEIWVGLLVKNKSKTDNIENCRFTLEDIHNTESDQNASFLPLYLTWSAIEHHAKQKGDEPLTILADNGARCDLAATSGDRSIATFTTSFANNTAATRVAPGTNIIRVKGNGTWKGHPISHSFLAELSFQPGENLHILRVTEENS